MSFSDLTILCLMDFLTLPSTEFIIPGLDGSFNKNSFSILL